MELWSISNCLQFWWVDDIVARKFSFRYKFNQAYLNMKKYSRKMKRYGSEHKCAKKIRSRYNVELSSISVTVSFVQQVCIPVWMSRVDNDIQWSILAWNTSSFLDSWNITALIEIYEFCHAWNQIYASWPVVARRNAGC